MWYRLILLTIVISSYNVTAESDSVGLVPSQSEVLIDHGIFERTSRSSMVSAPAVAPQEQVMMFNDMDGTLSSELLEGDILTIEKSIDWRNRRRASTDAWENGVIPYRMSASDPPYSADKWEMVSQAMKWFEEHTCIKFRPAISNEFYLEIRNAQQPPFCSSYVGRVYSLNVSQPLTLSDRRCFSKVGAVAHEIGHSIGLIHEQSRQDRDEHIKINPDAVSEKFYVYFQKDYNRDPMPGVKYDLSSIMHYAPETFQTEAQYPVIMSRDLEKQSLMGQREALSYYDVMSANKLYRCERHCTNRCENEGYPFYKNGRCICKCPEGLTGDRCETIDSDCGGSIDLRSGQTRSISSPGYPRSSLNKKCVWLITAPRDHLVAFNITDMDIALSGDRYLGRQCIHHIEVRGNILGQRGEIYCGTVDAIQPFTTMAQFHRSNKMMLILDTSDLNVVLGKGFTAEVQAYQDGCRSDPCFYGSSCISNGLAFTCRCRGGYTGRLCDTVLDGEYSCDFDKDGVCGWRNSEGDDFDIHRGFHSRKYYWTTENPAVQRNKGFFLVAPVESDLAPLSKAAIESPTFTSRATRCLSFNYQMGQDKQDGRLRVYTMDITSRQKTLLFERQGHQGNKWLLEQIEIRQQNDYKILFEITSSRTTWRNSVIALDDIEVRPQSCRATPCHHDSCVGADSTCVEMGPTSFVCICPSGRYGDRCELYDTVSGFTCDFNDENICGWVQDPTSQFVWSRTHGESDSKRRTGPIADATGKGYYMVADASSAEAQTGASARILSPRLGFSGTMCLSFYYHMQGVKDGKEFSVFVKQNGLTTATIFHRKGNQGDGWKYVEEKVQSPASTSQLALQATVGERHLSDIAIDQVQITRGSCDHRSSANSADFTSPATQTTTKATTQHPTTIRPTPRPASRTTQRATPTSRRTAGPQTRPTTSNTTHRPRPTTPSTTTQQTTTLRRVISSDRSPKGKVLYECDFEKDMCGFTFPYFRNKWTRTNARARTLSTVLSGAASGQYYLHIEGGSQSAGSRFVLRSTYVYHTGAACLSFQYHMYGQDVGSLEAKVWPSRGSKQTVWRRDGDQGDQWQQARVSVELYRAVQIEFEAMKGSTQRSGFALDLMRITEGECLSDSDEPASPTIDISCDFEDNNLCSLVTLRDDQNVWQVHQGQTTSQMTGPTEAYSGRKYAYIETSKPSTAGNRARLMTQSISHQAEDMCIEFYVHLYGAAIGELKIYKEYRDQSMANIYSMTGNQGNHWKHIKADISSSTKDYTVVIEYTVGSGQPSWTGDAAIDKLYIGNTKCS